MTSILIATEDPHLLFHRLFNSSFQTLGSINDRISHIFAYIFSSNDRRSSQVNQFGFEDLIAAVGSKYQHKTQNLLPPDIKSEGGGDPEAVFNVLDAILKCSLDRLKLMRENMSWSHTGHYNYKLEASYTQHIHTIRNLSLHGRLEPAFCLRNIMIQKGLVPDIITHNYLINGFCKVGEFEKAEWLVKQMGPTPNVATYNTLMKGYYAYGDIDKAQDLLSIMINGEVKPNIVSFNILVHALCKNGNLEEARVLVSKLPDEFSEKTVVTLTMLMDSSFKKGDMSLASKFWKEILSKGADIYAYNVVINGYCSRFDLITAYKYVNQMLKFGFVPDNFTYNTLINTLCKMKQIDDAFYLYKVMLKMGIVPDKVLYNILIQGLCKVGNVVTAHDLLNSMLKKSMVPLPLTWNVIIGGYAKQGDEQKVLHIIDQMLEYRVSPNVYTYNAYIQMLIKQERTSDAHSVLKYMILSGPSPDIVTYNLLVGADKEFGHAFSAKQVYDEMLKRGCEPDVITYTELIKGFCSRGFIKEAERSFSVDMLQNCKLVDHVPFILMMKKYFKIGNLDGAYSVYQKWLRMDQG